MKNINLKELDKKIEEKKDSKENTRELLESLSTPNEKALASSSPHILDSLNLQQEGVVVLSSGGYTNEDISLAMGIPEKDIKKILSTEVAKQRRKELSSQIQGEVYNKFRENGLNAAEVIIDIMHDPASKPRDKLAAAERVIKYGGHEPAVATKSPITLNALFVEETPSKTNGKIEKPIIDITPEEK